MGRKRQQWAAGDLFEIPLDSDRMGIGQVWSAEANAMNSALCMFYSTIVAADRTDVPMPSQSELICVQLTTRDLLDRHVWKVIGNRAPHSIEGIFPLAELRAVSFVGAKIRGSQIMADFMSAFHGLTAWDVYKEPDYFDHLLAPGVERPAKVLFGKPAA